MSVRNVLLFSLPFVWFFSIVALWTFVGPYWGLGLFLGSIAGVGLAFVGTSLVQYFGD